MNTAIVMYGPPAAGKDTLTATLEELNDEFRHYRRMKIGEGRRTGYRMISQSDLEQFAATGDIIYSNNRYGSTYVIDRPELTKMIAEGDVPVLHAGQPEAIDALLDSAPTIRWVIVELWCPRDVTAGRVAARNTGDATERLAAWDATPRLTFADVRIDTATVDPLSAAHEVVEAVHAARSTIVVPAMHFVDSEGALDISSTRRYATAAAVSWADLFLINGSTASGNQLATAERAAVLDVWLESVDPSRLLACTWSIADLQHAYDRHLTPMAVLQANTRNEAKQFLEALPTSSTIYSHPMFGSTFDAELALWAKRSGHLPAGGKLAKVQLNDIAEMRFIAPEFAIWDGSSRRIRESVGTGASGVVATPLAGSIADLPPRSLALVQSAVDTVQVELDRLPNRKAKHQLLLEMTRE